MKPKLLSLAQSVQPTWQLGVRISIIGELTRELTRMLYITLAASAKKDSPNNQAEVIAEGMAASAKKDSPNDQAEVRHVNN
jgi:hypothetical protein